jgi:hypothetical protein
MGAGSRELGAESQESEAGDGELEPALAPSSQLRAPSSSAPQSFRELAPQFPEPESSVPGR